MTNIEQQARELLAAELDPHERIEGQHSEAYADLRMAAIRAIVRALTPTGENVKHVEVLRGILDEYVTEEQRYGWTLERDALQAAMRALGAPDNAEVVGLDLSKVQRWDCETESDGIFNHAVMVPAYDGGYVCYADLQAAMATDNDGVVIRDYIVLRPDGIQYKTDASGAAMATKREGFRVYAEVDSSPPAATTDNDGAAHQHVWLTGVDNTGKWYCARCDETLDPCTNPRPARGKVAVSDEDIFLAEKAAHSIDYSFGLPTAEAAAIYRLVKAVQGEK